LTAKLVPKSVAQDDYDFTISMKDPLYDEMFGVMGQDLSVIGQATGTDGVSFDYEANLSTFMIDILEEPETDEKVLKFNKEAKQFVPGQFNVKVDDVKSETALSEEMLTLVQTTVTDLIKAEYDLMWQGDVESLQTLPVESLMPVLMLKHLGSFASTMIVSPDNIEYGFNPDQSFGRKAPSARKASMLKEIESKFSETAEGEDDAAV
jgi:hypothetical protein